LLTSFNPLEALSVAFLAAAPTSFKLTTTDGHCLAQVESNKYTIEDFGATDYYNLLINSTDTGANADTFELGANLSVVNNLTITNGTLDAIGTGALSVGGATNVDTSTNANATLNNSYRKSFYDTVNSTWWVFYYNGSAIEYAYSVSGSSWTTVSTLAYNTAEFTLTYKAISSTGYVFLATEANTYDIIMRRGTMSATSIDFSDAARTVFDGTGAADAYTSPSIVLDVANNYIWVAAVKDISSTLTADKQVYVRRSTNAGNGDTSAWQAATSVGRAAALIDEVVILPQTGSNMALLVNADTTNLLSYTYNGSSWSDANTGGDYSWFTFETVFNNRVFAMYVDGTDVYFGGDFTDAAGIANADGIVRWDGSAFYALGTGITGGNLVTAIKKIGSDLYVSGWFTQMGGVANTRLVARWSGSTWNAMGSGIAVGTNATALAVIGSSLYVGGNFTDAGGVTTADNVARWSGGAWSGLNTGLNSSVSALGVLGTDLYAGGAFVDAGGDLSADRFAKWNGSAWSNVGGGILLTAADGRVAFNNQVKTRILRNQRRIHQLIYEAVFAAKQED